MAAKRKGKITGRNDNRGPIDRARKRYVVPQAKRGSGVKYKLETFATVSQYKPGTKIKYGPNVKGKGSKSHVRYAKYMKAKTVGEALKFGSLLGDLCWELERGLYKVVGGERSEAQEIAAIGKPAYEKAKSRLVSFVGPRGLSMQLDDPRAQMELQREEAWRERRLRRCEELAPKLGLKMESMMELEALKITECADIRIQRRVGDALAAQKLKAGRKITDADVHEVLQCWGFQQNQGRFNVIPEGQKYVYSDTIGAIRRRTGVFGITPPTLRYPNFPKLLCRWMTDNCGTFGKGFVCTAINLNANYAAKAHRDQNNEGPSIIKAFGDFKGGRLLYWPQDSGKRRDPVEKLSDAEALRLDIRKGYTAFDGNKAHKVEPFKDGDRYSIVFFSASGYRKVSKANLKNMQKLGFKWPSPASMATLRKSAAKVIPQPGALKKGNPRRGGA